MWLDKLQKNVTIVRRRGLQQQKLKCSNRWVFPASCSGCDHPVILAFVSKQTGLKLNSLVSSYSIPSPNQVINLQHQLLKAPVTPCKPPEPTDCLLLLPDLVWGQDLNMLQHSSPIKKFNLCLKFVWGSLIPCRRFLPSLQSCRAKCVQRY